VIPLLASGSMIIDLELRNVLAQLSRRHRRRFKLSILVKYAERLNKGLRVSWLVRMKQM
jgi:hypothetical protein